MRAILRGRGRTVAAIAAVLTAGALALSGCASGDSDALSKQFKNGDKGYISADGTVKSIPVAQRGKPVSFTATTDQDQQVTAAQYRGKVLVVNFWYAGCPPCRAEASDLQSLNERYQSKGVQFLGVNLYDSKQTAQGFEKSFGITYPSVLDRTTGSVLLAFSGTVPPKSTPTTLVLDKQGRVSDRILGAIPDASVLASMIDAARAEGGQSGAAATPAPTPAQSGAVAAPAPTSTPETN